MLYDDLVQPGEFICHHGIKGQKWGVRRYQNPDGSLTEAGKKRYHYSEKEQKMFADKVVNAYSKEKPYATSNKVFKKVDPNKMSDAIRLAKLYKDEEKMSGLNAVADAIQEKFSKDRKALNDAYRKIVGFDDDSISDNEKIESLIDGLYYDTDVPDYLNIIGVKNPGLNKRGTNDLLDYYYKEYSNTINDIARDLVGNNESALRYAGLYVNDYFDKIVNGKK